MVASGFGARSLVPRILRVVTLKYGETIHSAVFCLDGMISSSLRSAGDRTAPEGGLYPRLKASGRRAGSDNPPPGGRTSCAQDHRFSGAALNAPSDPETGDSAVCMES